LRQDASGMISGRIGQEFEAGGCIRVSEVTPVISVPTGFTMGARALDGANSDTTVNITRVCGARGSMRPRRALPSPGCNAMTAVNGQFTVRKTPGTCPPQGPFLLTGGVWNTLDQSRSTVQRLAGQLNGQDFIVNSAVVSTIIGPIMGTARGRLNDLCDR